MSGASVSANVSTLSCQNLTAADVKYYVTEVLLHFFKKEQIKLFGNAESGKRIENPFWCKIPGDNF